MNDICWVNVNYLVPTDKKIYRQHVVFNNLRKGPLMDILKNFERDRFERNNIPKPHKIPIVITRSA